MCSLLTGGDLFLREEVFVYIHGKVHHVGLAKEIQFSMKQFFLIVDLKEEMVKQVGNRVILEYTVSNP